MTPAIRRVLSLSIKETRQMTRDPSSILVSTVLPMILLFLFGYGISLDAKHLRLGIALESTTPDAMDLSAAFLASEYFDVVTASDHRPLVPKVVSGDLRGVLVIPQNFSRDLRSGNPLPVQLVVDGSETNTARFVQSYSQRVLAGWQAEHAAKTARGHSKGQAQVVPRTWYNPELDSRNSLLPGSLTVIMALIGTFLTSLVVAREWERGTMESVLATPLRPYEVILAKVVPYFVLGMVSFVICAAVSVFVFQVPLRGSVPALLATTAAFLLTSLMQGLMISTITKDQFLASQVALVSAFLPAFLLSGFIFEISSMPLPMQWISRVIPARHYVTCLQSAFLAGDIWALFLPACAYLVVLSLVFLAVTFLKTPRFVR